MNTKTKQMEQVSYLKLTKYVQCRDPIGWSWDALTITSHEVWSINRMIFKPVYVLQYINE